MRNSILVIFCLLLLYSCKNEVETPNGILPGEKMEPILLDLIRADEIINQQSYGDSASSIRGKREVMYQKVFTVHGVTRDQFNNSFTFYQNHPDLLKGILDSMYSVVKKETEDTSRQKKSNTALKEEVLKKIKNRPKVQ